MEQIRPVVDRLPHRELEIRRWWAKDTTFKTICADYAEASRALLHWRRVSAEGNENGQRNVDEYIRLENELAEEIIAYLDRSMSSPGPAAAAAVPRVER